jgi:tetratricopeptide (TPR) repeat protein
VYGCTFKGPVESVSTHIEESTVEGHSFEELGHTNSNEFREKCHVDQAKTMVSKGREAADAGEYEKAVQRFEDAHFHYDKARTIADIESAEYTARCEEVLREIEKVELEQSVQKIDNQINEVESLFDSGDRAMLNGEPSTATDRYEEALHLLDEIRPTVEEHAPQKLPTINELTEYSHLRRESLENFGNHQALLDAYRDAQNAQDEGDTAFKDDEYELAVEKYETALKYYTEVEELLDEFTFETQASDDTVCSFCGLHFDIEIELEVVEFEDGERTACPACAQFGAEGVLPHPSEVTQTVEYVRENIESIKSGEYGLDWTTSSEIDTSSDKDPQSGSNSGPTDQQLLIQLIGTFQSVEGLPTAGDLDQHTDFGYRVYQERFGSIKDALSEAGFDV